MSLADARRRNPQAQNPGDGGLSRSSASGYSTPTPEPTGLQAVSVLAPLRGSGTVSDPLALDASGLGGGGTTWAGLIGDGSSTSILIRHGLGATDWVMSVWETAGQRRRAWVETQPVSPTEALLVFANAPAKDSLRVYMSSGSSRAHSETIGDGTKTIHRITHNLDTDDVHCSVKELQGQRREVHVEARIVDPYSLDLIFAVPPAASSMRVSVSR